MSVIFLNGCTSAGKTSITRALQELLRSPHLKLGIDDAFAMLPLRLHNHPNGFFFDTDDRGEIRLNHGPTGFAVLTAHSAMAAALARSGNDVILDEVVLEAVLRHDWYTALVDIPVFWVGVHCDLAELERREVERGDRLIGQARGQFDLVHQGMDYDLMVDSSSLSRAAVARQIADAYEIWRATIAF